MQMTFVPAALSIEDKHTQGRSYHEHIKKKQLQKLHDPALLGNCRKYLYRCRNL